MFKSARGRARDRGGKASRPPLRDNRAVSARSHGRSDDCAKVCRVFNLIERNQQRRGRALDQAFKVVVISRRANGHHVLVVRIPRHAVQSVTGRKPQGGALRAAKLNDLFHARPVVSFRHQNVFDGARDDSFFHSVDAVERFERSCALFCHLDVLFHRHRFGKVARLIYVAASQHAHMIGEQLQGNYLKDRRKIFVGVRQLNDVMGHRFHFVVALSD